MTEMLTGALIFVAGMCAGTVIPFLPRRGRPPRPACQCRHPRALHDPVTNQCHDRVPRSSGSAIYAQCPCRQYVGPEPMPELFSRGVELPEVGA